MEKPEQMSTSSRSQFSTLLVSVVPVILLVRVIEGASTSAGYGADTSTFTASSQGADRSSTGRANTHPLRRVDVAFVSNVLAMRAVMSYREAWRRRAEE